MPFPEYTPEEYRMDDGNHCPNCGGEKIVQTGSVVAFCKIIRHTRCDDCYATWDEVFRIAGYENLETP